MHQEWHTVAVLSDQPICSHWELISGVHKDTGLVYCVHPDAWGLSNYEACISLRGLVCSCGGACHPSAASSAQGHSRQHWTVTGSSFCSCTFSGDGPTPELFANMVVNTCWPGVLILDIFCRTNAAKVLPLTVIPALIAVQAWSYRQQLQAALSLPMTTIFCEPGKQYAPAVPIQSGVDLLQDLYVMRRGVGVYERLIRRFTAQDTDYQLLLSTFAEGLYTEMDFKNEALNMERMTMLMEESEFGSRDVIIPKPIMERTTRSATLYLLDCLLAYPQESCSACLQVCHAHGLHAVCVCLSFRLMQGMTGVDW